MSPACASPNPLLLAMALSVCVMLGYAAPAAARATGIVTDTCQACHGGSDIQPPTLSLIADPPKFNPGDLVNFTLTIRASSVKVGGAFITAGGVGALRPLAGEGLQVNGLGLTHSAPKAAVNGEVTFQFAWQAPANPGGVDIRVAALAGNGNNAPTGDSPGGGNFQWAFGCPPRIFYVDLDRDGYGAERFGTLLGCANDAAPIGYAITDGDCDENDEKVHPGASEVCNRKDDDCNAQIDEGSPPVMMWPDADGDGYYGAQVGIAKLGCADVSGYAALAGDCNDADATIHPGGVEVCNLLDDNCDGEVDERVRPRCGLGWCARQSRSCSPADCQPGPPATETCNAFDDDCDGAIDNDACPSSYICVGEACVPSEGTNGTGGTATGGSVGNSNSSGSSGAVAVVSSPIPLRGAARESGCALVGSAQRPNETGGAHRTLVASLAYAGSLSGILIGRRRKRRSA